MSNFPGGPQLEVAIGPTPPITPSGGVVFHVATGGTAVTVFAAGAIVTQGIIANPSTASEILYVDFVNSPAAVAPGSNGTTFELAAGQSMVIPSVTTAVKVNATTSAHAFTAVMY